MIPMESPGIRHAPTFNIFQVEAAAESARMMTTKTFNMIVLGAFLKIKPLVAPENIHKGLEKSLPHATIT